MEEKHIVDKHESTSLCHGRKETIKDSCRHKRAEGGSASTPGCCGEGYRKEPGKDWKAAEVGGKGYDYHSACSQHEDISDLGVIDCIWAHMPYAGNIVSVVWLSERIGTYVACGSRVTAPVALP
jgi:hypothetical protein